jgi:hypothetical protein
MNNYVNTNSPIVVTSDYSLIFHTIYQHHTTVSSSKGVGLTVLFCVILGPNSSQIMLVFRARKLSGWAPSRRVAVRLWSASLTINFHVAKIS